MDGQNKNLIFATVLSFFVILTWFFLFPPEELPQDIDNTIELTSDINNSGLLPPIVNTTSNISKTVAGLNNSKGAPAPRVEISTPNLRRKNRSARAEKLLRDLRKKEKCNSLIAHRQP